MIDDRLEWTVNMEACYKRANQRKLKNFQLSDNLLYLLYQSVVQGILVYDQVYSSYSNARPESRLGKTAQHDKCGHDNHQT